MTCEIELTAEEDPLYAALLIADGAPRLVRGARDAGRRLDRATVNLTDALPYGRVKEMHRALGAWLRAREDLMIPDASPLGRLHAAYAWPARRPDVPRDPSGWFQPGNARLLAARLTAETRVVIELGSWLGQSTRFLLQRAPNAVVCAVDHWEGSAEHRANPEFESILPRLYSTFLANCWDWRDRLVPVRADTLVGMAFINGLGIAADLVYIDADHATEAVVDDLEAAHACWPGAMILGDDWLWQTVRVGVERFAAEHKFSIEVDLNGWALHR